MRTTILPAFPAGANPFRHDAFRMGSSLGTNLMAMYERHDNQMQPYIILCDLTTGERLRVDFATPKDHKPYDLMDAVDYVFRYPDVGRVEVRGWEMERVGDEAHLFMNWSGDDEKLVARFNQNGERTDLPQAAT